MQIGKMSPDEAKLAMARAKEISTIIDPLISKVEHLLTQLSPESEQYKVIHDQLKTFNESQNVPHSELARATLKEVSAKKQNLVQTIKNILLDGYINFIEAESTELKGLRDKSPSKSILREELTKQIQDLDQLVISIETDFNFKSDLQYQMENETSTAFRNRIKHFRTKEAKETAEAILEQSKGVATFDKFRLWLANEIKQTQLRKAESKKTGPTEVKLYSEPTRRFDECLGLIESAKQALQEIHKSLPRSNNADRAAIKELINELTQLIGNNPEYLYKDLAGNTSNEYAIRKANLESRIEHIKTAAEFILNKNKVNIDFPPLTPAQFKLLFTKKPPKNKPTGTTNKPIGTTETIEETVRPRGHAVIGSPIPPTQGTEHKDAKHSTTASLLQQMPPQTSLLNKYFALDMPEADKAQIIKNQNEIRQDAKQLAALFQEIESLIKQPNISTEQRLMIAQTLSDPDLPKAANKHNLQKIYATLYQSIINKLQASTTVTSTASTTVSSTASTSSSTLSGQTGQNLTDPKTQGNLPPVSKSHKIG